MNNVLILDTETSGLDPKTSKTIEVGVILFSLDHMQAISSFSSLIRCDGQPKETEAINGIPSGMLPLAPEGHDVWAQVRTYVGFSKAILAHNAEFDKMFVPEDVAGKTPWICTMDDVTWPRAGSSKGLVALALAHGIGVSSAHRALTDCGLISALLSRTHELGGDVKAMLRRGLRPKAKFKAVVSYETNQLAKDAGFKWHPAEKMWARSMACEDVGALPFKVLALP